MAQSAVENRLTMLEKEGKLLRVDELMHLKLITISLSKNRVFLNSIETQKIVNELNNKICRLVKSLSDEPSDENKKKIQLKMIGNPHKRRGMLGNYV